MSEMKKRCFTSKSTLAPNDFRNTLYETDTRLRRQRNPATSL